MAIRLSSDKKLGIDNKDKHIKKFKESDNIQTKTNPS